MGSPFGGGGNGVTVNIGGNAVQLQTAAQQASSALGNVGSAAQAAANTTGAAMRAAAAGFDQLTQSIKYLQQAQVALGASQAQGDAAFLNEATSAQDYSARLQLLTSSLQLFNAQQQQTGATAQQTGSQLDFNVFGRITGWMFSFNQLIDGARNLQSVLTQLGSTAFGVFNTLSMGIPNALVSSVGMLQQYAGQAMGMLQQYGVPLGPQGIAASFDLNKTTEKTRVGWGYLFGGGGRMQTTGPYAGQIVDPSGTAESMMQWSSQESMKVPFTRQDMMAAMTQLGLVPKDRTTGAHMSAADIEHYLPILSDLAATYGSTAYGGQGVNLQQAAYAVRMSAEGMARMLKMDLNINPEELIHYGLKATGSGYAIHITDPSTLLPALEAFARAKGVSGGINDVSGASGMMEQGTFSGAWSSFVDRLQNFGLQVGGTDLSGNIRQDSLFGRMKQDLNTVSDWLSNPKNAAGISQLADTVQGALGGGTTVIGGVLGGVFQGMSQSGTGNTLLDDLQRFSDFLHDPTTQDALRNFGDELGHLVGPALQTASQAVQGFFQGIGNSGAGKEVQTVLDGLGKWFADPAHQQDITNFTTALGDLAGNVVTWTGQLLQAAGDFLGGASNVLGTFSSALTTNLINQDVAAMSQSDRAQYLKHNPNAKGISSTEQQLIEAAVQAYFDQMAKDSGMSQDWANQAYANWANSFNGPNKFNSPNGGKPWKGVTAYTYANGEPNQQASAQAYWNSLSAQQRALDQHLAKSGGFSGMGPIDPNTGIPELWEGVSRRFATSSTAHGQEGALGTDAVTNALLGSAGAGAPDLTRKGRDAGTAYLSGFQSTMQNSSTPTTAVNAYIAAFDAKISQAGDPLAVSIATYVDQAIKIQIANALEGYGGDLRQAGGYPRAAGIGPGYR